MSPTARRILVSMTPSPAAPRRHLPSSPFAAPATQAVEVFEVGDRVSHDKYGLGRVLDAGQQTVTVEFGSERIRMAPPYSRLTRL